MHRLKTLIGSTAACDKNNKSSILNSNKLWNTRAKPAAHWAFRHSARPVTRRPFVKLMTLGSEFLVVTTCQVTSLSIRGRLYPVRNALFVHDNGVLACKPHANQPCTQLNRRVAIVELTMPKHTFLFSAGPEIRPLIVPRFILVCISLLSG